MTVQEVEGELAPPAPRHVDVVVVAYNSADVLRECVGPLADVPGLNVVVIDNASPDASLESVADLPVDAVRAGRNGGFAAGCNLGIARGDAPYVLLLNPDAAMTVADVDALVRVLDEEPAVGMVAPLILDADGRPAPSLRRFPRLRSTYAQALFLHRLAPRASWTDELVRDPEAYRRPGSPEWVSGACMLIRRSVLEQVGGLDERFFLYCEDIDLCARTRAAGWDIRFEPAAVVRHREGHAAPRSATLRLLARNRVIYARLHRSPAAARLEALGVALGHATHVLTSRPAVARGHVAALRAALRTSARPRIGQPEG